MTVQDTTADERFYCWSTLTSEERKGLEGAVRKEIADGIMSGRPLGHLQSLDSFEAHVIGGIDSILQGQGMVSIRAIDDEDTTLRGADGNRLVTLAFGVCEDTMRERGCECNCKDELVREFPLVEIFKTFVEGGLFYRSEQNAVITALRECLAIVENAESGIDDEEGMERK